MKTLLQGSCCQHGYSFLSASLDLLLVAINYRRSCIQHNLLLISSSVRQKPFYDYPHHYCFEVKLLQIMLMVSLIYSQISIKNH